MPDRGAEAASKEKRSKSCTVELQYPNPKERMFLMFMVIFKNWQQHKCSFQLHFKAADAAPLWKEALKTVRDTFAVGLGDEDDLKSEWNAAGES